MRRWIVSTFEFMCILIVVLPTAAALAVFLNSQTVFALLTAIGMFFVTCFIAGGALTLVEVARNTRDIVSAIRRLEDAYLRGVAANVQRSEKQEPS